MGARKNTALATSPEASKDRQYIKSLARGFEVLRAFRSEDRGISNAELARRTGLPRPTLSRLTFTLLSLGYLHLDEETGRYFLHPHILTIGHPVLSQLSIRELARPLMQELANTVKGAVVLGICNRLSIIIVERASHRTMATWPLDIGVARDIATTAIGRAYIVALDPDDRAALLERVRKDDPSRWREIERGIDNSLRSYAEKGYTVSAGDWAPEFSAVGVPLTLKDGTIIPLNCGIYSNRVEKGKLEDMGERLVNMVAELARIYGDNPTGL